MKLVFAMLPVLTAVSAFAGGPYIAESGDRLIVISVTGRSELGGMRSRSNEAYEIAISSAILSVEKQCKRLNGEIVGEYVATKTYNGSGSNTQTLVLSQMCRF